MSPPKRQPSAAQRCAQAFIEFGRAWDMATKRDHMRRAQALADRGDPKGERWLKELRRE